jgi:hypothetical protein
MFFFSVLATFGCFMFAMHLRWPPLATIALSLFSFGAIALGGSLMSRCLVDREHR